MQRVVVFSIMLFFTGGFTFGASAQKADPAVYGALPTVSTAAISPDGKTIAQLQNVGGVNAVAFHDLTGESEPIGVKIGDQSARDLLWAGPNHVIVLISVSTRAATGDGIKPMEFWRWVSIDRRTGDAKKLFRGNMRINSYFYSGSVHSTLPEEPENILVGHFGPYGTYSLYKVNLVNGDEKLFARGDRVYRALSGARRTVDWVVNSAGEPIVRVDYDLSKEERQFYKPDGDKGWTLSSVVEEREEDEISVIAYAQAGASNLIHALMTINGFRGLHIFDVDTASAVAETYTLPNLDVRRVVFDLKTSSVLGIRYIDDFWRTKFIDQAMRRIQSNLESALPNTAPLITSWSDDKMKFIVRVSYADHPDQFFLYDHTKKSLALAAPTYDELDGSVYAKKEKYDFIASDGMPIPGYLTIPVSADKKRMPLIVMPHEGPADRVTQQFHWWPFFYAARGYLVYQPNFRGSDGYGADFRNAGNEEWGGKIQDDITEGVQKLIQDGIVDPARVCIVGAEFGGYAALTGAALTPDIYACAVSVNGISNVGQLLSDAAGRETENEYWKKRIGSRFADGKKLRTISPVHNADKIKAPVLLIHSEHDTSVRIGQSRQMRRELRDRNKDHEFIILEGADHALSSGSARTEMLRASIDFIDKHIGQ